MKQIYFIITLFTTLTIGVLPLNLGITLAQNETSEIDDSPLITTAEIDKGLENNTASQMANNTSIIE
jgi:hypothetical protein